MLGYQRTLQASDLWKLDESRESGFLSAKLDDAWSRRAKEAEDWNVRLINGDVRPSHIKRFGWALRALASRSHYADRYALLEKRWREVDGKREPSLAWALNDTFGFFFWSGGVFKVAPFLSTAV